MTSTIVFGPSGSVASAAVRTAQKQGAKVCLAMRDPEKPIPNLNSDDSLIRVQADLTKPETIRDAVAKTGAKHAFIYLIFGTSDHMRASIIALKNAGIEYVVFLSSYGIQVSVESVPSSDYIAYAHARVEMNLEEIFGPSGYVALRPAYFASNSLQWKGMITSGEVKLLYPDATWDYISTDDIGRVCGILLAGGLQVAKGQNVIYLCGPKLTSQREAVETIGRVLGKDIRIVEVNEDDALKVFMQSGLPEPIAKSTVTMLRERIEMKNGMFMGQTFEDGQENLHKYGGRQPSSFEQWVSENKLAFTGA